MQCQKKRYKTDGLKRGIIKAANNIEFPTVQVTVVNGTDQQCYESFHRYKQMKRQKDRQTDRYIL